MIMMTDRRGVIYGLVDPSNGSIRYVGKTVQDPARRLRQHQHSARTVNRTHLHAWLRSLSCDPAICVLERGGESELSLLERKWIASMPNLVNHTVGGDGGATRNGMQNSDKQKAAASVSSRGRSRGGHRHDCSCGWCCGGRPGGWKMSDEQKEKISRARKGVRLTTDHKEAIGRAHAGRTLPVEQRIKMSEARKKWWAMKDAAERTRIAQKGHSTRARQR